MKNLEEIDLENRVATERKLEKAPTAPPPNGVFAQSGHSLVSPSLLGIKTLNIVTNRLSLLLGKSENTQRFLQIALFQSEPTMKTAEALLHPGSSNKVEEAQPLVVACAFKSERLFLFTRNEPKEDETLGRDVFNEKPKQDLSHLASKATKAALPTSSTAILQTTKGDIFIELFPNEAPKAVESFVTHSRNKFYEGIVFHRIIRNFMLQTGDPLGDGTGGESIWGKDFEDEFHPKLRHDKPFMVSMANAGPNTNASQFFITTVPAPWLDDKHTIFGRVIKGMDVCRDIETVTTNKYDKPRDDIRIISIQIPRN